MLQEDKICLAVTEEIKQYRDRIETTAGPYANVVALFAFELQYMFTQHILNHASGEFSIQPGEADRIYRWGSRLYNVYYGGSANRYRRAYLLLIAFFRITAFFRKGPSVCLSFPNKPVRFYQSIFRNKFVIPYKVYVHFPEYDMQVNTLKELIEKICTQYEIPDAEKIFGIYKSFLDRIYSPAPQKPAADILLCGSPALLFTRVLAVSYLQAGKRVIAEGHGCNQSLTFDEPYFANVEFNYCTDYLDFGTAPASMESEYFRYLDPNRLNKINFHFKTSELIEKIYRKGQISGQPITARSRILYIPDNLNGVARYAPFHSVSNEKYIRFKKALFALGLDIEYKKSPNFSKDACIQQLPFIPENKVVENRMEELLEGIETRYDAIFVDYLGTTYSMAAATNLPVIFFNLQTRNKSPRCQQALSERFYIKTIDFDGDVEEQVSQAIEEYNASNRQYVNNYTEAYSLNASRKTSRQVLEELLQEI